MVNQEPMIEEPAQETLPGKRFRQPYRITMAVWDYSIYQKRVLSGIIASLQKEIAILEKGFPAESMPLFAGTGDWVELQVALKHLVRKGNNHHMIHRAFTEFRDASIPILLPEVKGKKGHPIPEQRFILKPEKAESSGFERNIRIRIKRDLVLELVRTSCGLTSLSQDVVWSLNSAYSLRMYEFISHWKDKSSLTVSLEQFRRMFSLEHKIKETKELIRKIIRPAQRELEKKGDVYFLCHPIKSGTRITHLNLVIQHRKNREQEERVHMQLREQLINILRIRFGFKEEHFRKIQHALNDTARIRPMNEKVGYLWQYLDQHPGEVRNIPEWMISSLQEIIEGRAGTRRKITQSQPRGMNQVL